MITSPYSFILLRWRLIIHKRRGSDHNDLPTEDQKGQHMKRKKAKLFALLLCILLTAASGLILTSCGTGNEETPTQVAKSTLDALKDQNFNVLKTKYAGDVSDFDLDSDKLLGKTYKLNKKQKKITNRLVKKLLEFNYTLGDENVRGSSATIDVTFRTYDFKKLVTDLEKDTVATSKKEINSVKMTEKEIEEKTKTILFKLLDSQLGKLKTRDLKNTVTLKLEKKDGKWLVSEQSGKFYDAMFGNLYTAMSSIRITY